MSPHGKSGTLSDSLANLGVLLILVLAYLIVTFFKWWLLVIVPSLYCAMVLLRKPKILRGAFSSSANDLATDKDRSRIRLYFVILAIVFTGLAIATEGGNYPIFAASLFWLMTIYLAKAQKDAAKLTKSFVYHLAKASLELGTIITSALAAYSIFAWRVSMLPTDMATLFLIRSWESHISWVHEFLKSVSPSKPQTIIVIVALYVGRILEIRYGHDSKTVTHAWQVTKFALKWPDRLSLAALVAASFTFLATESDGPAAPLKARLKEMEKDYQHFRSQTTKALAVETKRQLSQRAWKEMPPPLRQQLLRAGAIQKEKADLLEKIRWADGQYDLDGTPSAATKQEYATQLEEPPDHAEQTEQQTQQISAGHGEEEYYADFATAGELRDGAADASDARSKIANEPLDTKSEMGEELAKNVQEFVADADRLTDNVGLLKVLADRYPLLEEFLSAINDAFNDYVYDKLKSKVDRVARTILQGPKKSALAEIKAGSAELAQSARLRWHSDDPVRSLELDRRLSAEKSNIWQAHRQLEVDAKRAEKRQVRKIVDEIRQHELEYRKIAAFMPEHINLMAQTAKIEGELRALERLPADPDPLSGFERPSRPNEPSPDLTHQADGSSTSHPQSALEQLSILNESCATQIRSIVGATKQGAQSRLQAALGRKAFDEYTRQIEFWRALRESGPLGPYWPHQFPGLEPGIRGRLPDRRFEPKVEPRVEPRIEFVP